MRGSGSRMTGTRDRKNEGSHEQDDRYKGQWEQGAAGTRGSRNEGQQEQDDRQEGQKERRAAGAG